MLNHIIEAKNLAESAVSAGDDTLKKANNTYHLLQSFQSEVQKSSENAKIALQDVSDISKQIKDTINIIENAEEVNIRERLFKLFFWPCSRQQALEDSYNNADKAKSNAQEAQERYADQASKVFLSS